MKIALVLCPSWAIESPSYTLALLSAILKRHGHHVKCFDLNIDMYRRCEDQKEAESWQMNEKNAVWCNEEYVSRFMWKYDSLIDSFINNILSYGPEVIGFTVYSTSRYFSYEMARRIKRKDPKSVIIFGGPQCFNNCEGIDTLERPYIDGICFGEGDIAFPQMLDIVNRNNKGPFRRILNSMSGNKKRLSQCPGFGIRDKAEKVINCGEHRILENLDELPYADYSDFDINKYTKNLLPIITSRGCFGKCKFCNESPYWKKYRFRKSESIYDEIAYQIAKHPQIKEFWFNDSLINGNIKMLDELCDLFIKNKLNIRYGGQALIRPEMNIELLKKMKRSGCVIISYGLESGSDKILKKMGKLFNAEIAEKVIRDTCEAGIDVIFNIIVGFPGETEKEIEETKRFIERNLRYAKEITITPLLLIKGSSLYENAEEASIDMTTKYDQLCWKTLDTSNNYETRMERLNLLRNAIGKKTCMTSSLRLKGGAKLRICLVSREYPPDTAWGGIGTYTYQLAHGLTDAGCHVHVICQDTENRSAHSMDEGVHVHRIAHKSFFPLKGSFLEFGLRWEYSQSVHERLKDIIGEYDIDIVEAPNFSGEGFIYSFHKKTPLVTRLHTNFSEVIDFIGWDKNFDRRLSCWIENTVILRSDLIICSTESHAALIAKEIGIERKDIRIIPLGVNLPRIKEKEQIDGSRGPMILFVGRLEKRKGVHVLIQAVPLVLKKFPGATFIIIGRDSFTDEECVSFAGSKERSYKEQLIRMIPPEYQDRVKFLGYVQPEELDKHYRLCDIFVAPSLYESFGFIYIEAMSYAKPVIGCGVGGVPEVIKDGVTGFLVPPEDVMSLANTINRLLNDPVSARQVGDAARKYTEERFNRDIMVHSTLEAYSETCKNFKAKGF